MTERAWRMRRYERGDEVALLALFNRIFAKQRSLEHWRWQFERNPYAPPTIVVALRKADDHLVGSHVIMPIALNLAGRKVLAGHTLDLVVHEDFRRQGIFQITAKECFTWCRERGMRAVLAFPNDQSYPGFVRSLGWSRILDPVRWDRRLGLRSTLGDAAWARALSWAPDAIVRGLWRPAPSRALTVEWLAAVPGDHDALWSECAPEMRLSLWKDREYLAWRYDQNPDHRFEYVALRERRRLRALSVLWRERGRATICEFLAPRTSGATLGRSLSAAACEGCSRRGDDRIAFVGYDDGWFADSLVGFQSRPAPESVLTGCGLEGDELDALVRERSNWTVSYGDADYV